MHASRVPVRRLHTLGASLFALWAPTALAASPPPLAAAPLVQLNYVQPSDATCPDATRFRAAVSAYLGRDPFDDDAVPAAARVLNASVQRSDAGLLSLDITEAGTTSHREFVPGGACTEQMEQAALALALAVDPLAGTNADNTPQPAPPATPVAPPPPPPAPVRTRAPDVAAIAAADFGLLPGLSYGGGARVTQPLALWPDAPVDAVAIAFGLGGRAPAAQQIDASATVGGPAALIDAGICAAHDIWHVCAVALGGAFFASATGVADARSGALPLLTTGARAGVHIPLGMTGLSTHFDVDGGASVVGARILSTTGAEIWRTPPAFVSVSLGVGYDFGTARP